MPKVLECWQCPSRFGTRFGFVQVFEYIDAPTLYDLLCTPSQAAEVVGVVMQAVGELADRFGILHNDLANFHNILVPQKPRKLVIIDWDYISLRDEYYEDVFEERVDATVAKLQRVWEQLQGREHVGSTENSCSVGMED